MNRNILNKKVMKQKLTCFFILFSFLFSQIFYVNTAYAGMPVVDLPAFGFDTGNKIIDKLLEGVGGIAAGAISSILTKFAKDSGQRVVQGLTTGDWGGEPLFFDIPFEDYLTAAVDSVAGNFLDDINKDLKFDLCKPVDELSLNWKFKIMLNIKPDLASLEKKTVLKGPVCTLSKFIAATKTTLNTVITSVKKSLVGDCFDEFLSNDICSAQFSNLSAMEATGGALVGSASNAISAILGKSSDFSVTGLRNSFGYEGSVNFCKKGQYYIKEGASLTLAEIAKQVVLPNSCNSPSTVATKMDDTFWTQNKGECMKYDFTNVAINTALKNAGVGGTFNDGDCLYSMSYCRFDAKDAVVLDKTKRKSFIDKYNNCFRPKLAEYLGNIVEIGDALPKEKMIENGILTNCGTSLNVIKSYDKNVFGYGDIFAKAIQSSYKLVSYKLDDGDNNDFQIYIAKYLDGFLSSSLPTVTNILSSTGTAGYGNDDSLYIRKQNLISGFTPIIAKDVEKCNEYLARGVYDIFSEESGKKFLYCEKGNGITIYPVLYYQKGSNFKYAVLNTPDDMYSIANDS